MYTVRVMLDADLPHSRLYTFIDGSREFAIYFLEGQRLIRDLALTHDVRGPGFAWFRDVVLSVQPMIALLKHGEQLGFYIDSRDPFLRLKIETGHHGGIRCALVPEALDEFPESMDGVVRVIKLFPHNRPPYESVLAVESEGLRDMVNRVLRESYQIHSAVLVSPWSDQSLLLHQLPPVRGLEEYDYSLEAVRDRRREIDRATESIFREALHDAGAVEDAFGRIGFRLLAWRLVRFQCSCSAERVIRALLLASGGAPGVLFDPGQEALQVTCEYCKSSYSISRDDLAQASHAPN